MKFFLIIIGIFFLISFILNLKMLHAIKKSYKIFCNEVCIFFDKIAEIEEFIDKDVDDVNYIRENLPYNLFLISSLDFLKTDIVDNTDKWLEKLKEFKEMFEEYKYFLPIVLKYNDNVIEAVSNMKKDVLGVDIEELQSKLGIFRIFISFNR